MVRRILLGIVGILVIALIAFGGFYWWQSRPELPALAQTPTPDSFPREQIEPGAQLAALGDCTTCHTVPEGKPFAGGLPVSTPFGTLYASNITPDRETGIGSWPEDAFRRALREGVGRKGTHYYPAFPYDHFTKASDEDIAAVYAFLMTRQPVHQENRQAELIFPLNWRVFAAGWQLFFLHSGPYQPDTAQSAEWNRGAYLVASLGHCGACHTPRNFLGAEEAKNDLSGGVAEDWIAPALNHNSPAPVPWTADQLYAYLRNGFADQHGVAAGPMQPVVFNMQRMPEQDVRAIATYLASVEGPQDKAARERQTQAALQFAQQRAAKVAQGAPNATTGSAGNNDNASGNASTNSDGALIFAGACATCHHEGGQLPVSRPLPLALSSVVNEDSAANFVRVVRDGIHPPNGQRGPIMPGFEGALTNQQIAALANYVRQQYSQKPGWQNVDKTVSNARGTQSTARGSQ
jgi:mono/diheme cytochrome c family protein